jgi:hypothetical protein
MVLRIAYVFVTNNIPDYKNSKVLVVVSWVGCKSVWGGDALLHSGSEDRPPIHSVETCGFPRSDPL